MKKDFNKEVLLIQALLGIMVLKHTCIKNNKQIKRKTKIQKKFLQIIFQITKYPSINTILDISILLNLNFNSINVWFQNTRHIYKMQNLKNKKIKNRINISPLILYNIYLSILTEKKLIK